MKKWRIEFDGDGFYVLERKFFIWFYLKSVYQGGGLGPIYFESLAKAVECINIRIDYENNKNLIDKGIKWQ